LEFKNESTRFLQDSLREHLSEAVQNFVELYHLGIRFRPCWAKERWLTHRQFTNECPRHDLKLLDLPWQAEKYIVNHHQGPFIRIIETFHLTWLKHGLRCLLHICRILHWKVKIWLLRELLLALEWTVRLAWMGLIRRLILVVLLLLMIRLGCSIHTTVYDLPLLLLHPLDVSELSIFVLFLFLEVSLDLL
jgi:hypothetical protein